MFDRIHEMRTPDHHQPQLLRRPGARRHPLRADDGPADRGPRHPRVPLGGQGRGAVPQGRQGPGGRGRRRPADEADARPRRAARAGRRQGRVRHEGCARSSSSPTRRASRPSSTSSSRSAGRSSATGWCRSSSPRSTSRARRRPRPRRCSRPALLAGLDADPRRAAGDVQAHAARARTASTPTSSPTRRSPRSWRCPAATPATRPTTAWPATRA